MAERAKKAPKWSKESVVTLLSGYDPEASDSDRGKQVVALMETLGKTKREVTGKLVAEKKYVAPEKPAKAAKKDEGPTKKELIRSLEDEGFIASKGLEGATKDAITEVLTLFSLTE